MKTAIAKWVRQNRAVTVLGLLFLAVVLLVECVNAGILMS